jgi:Zn-dependent protease with chaperone function
VITLAMAPLAVGLLTCLLGGRVGRLIQPRHSVPLLTGLALTVAVSTGIALSALAILVFAQVGPIARLGHWSAPALRAGAGYPVGVGVLASGVVAVCLAAAVIRGTHSVRALARASRAARGLTPLGGAGDLVLVDDEAPTAYTVPGWHSRIIVSTSMLAALSADERRVVLAHEAAHLRHRHHMYLHLAALSAAANPLLRPVVAAIALGIERWADEDAASEVRDREMAARGLARAALAQAGHRRCLGVLGVADSAVVARVRALLAPAPAPRRLACAIIIVAAATCWLAAALAAWRTNELIQIAESAFVQR